MNAWEKRIKEAEMVLDQWMKRSEKSMTIPDDCMDELIQQGIYKEPMGKARALAFRNDLRSLRKTNGLPYETSLLRIEQEVEHRNWYIYRK